MNFFQDLPYLLAIDVMNTCALIKLNEWKPLLYEKFVYNELKDVSFVTYKEFAYSTLTIKRTNKILKPDKYAFVFEDGVKRDYDEKKNEVIETKTKDALLVLRKDDYAVLIAPKMLKLSDKYKTSDFSNVSKQEVSSVLIE